MLLKFVKLLRRDDLIQTLVWRVSNDRIVNDNWSNDERVNQFDSCKARFSNERSQLWKNQRLCRHLFLYVSQMRSLFQLVVDLNFQHLNLTRRLFNDVANFDKCLHVEFYNISDKIYQLIFDQREDDFMTTISQQTMLVHCRNTGL